MSAKPTIHASAVLVGRGAILVRGPSGAGKSRLVLSLLQAAARGELAFARLVGDDRVHVEATGGALIVRPAAPLAGRIEAHGLGILRRPHESVAAVSGVVDLHAANASRLPDGTGRVATIEGVTLPRLGLASASDPLGAVLLWITGGFAP